MNPMPLSYFRNSPSTNPDMPLICAVTTVRVVDDKHPQGWVLINEDKFDRDQNGWPATDKDGNVIVDAAGRVAMKPPTNIYTLHESDPSYVAPPKPLKLVEPSTDDQKSSKAAPPKA